MYVIVLPSKETNFSFSDKSYFIIILSASTYSTVPSPFELIKTLESEATCNSKPVPTIGACGLNNGTACLIIFEPINALLASSCSKKGIKEADIEAI